MRNHELTPADRLNQFARELVLTDATRDELIGMWDPTSHRDIRIDKTSAYLGKIGIFSDTFAVLDELKEARDETKDELTDSLTRRAFNNLLGEAMDKYGSELEEKGWMIQITLIDLNKLGQHNDLGNYNAGDTATKAVTGATRRTFRRNQAGIEIDEEEISDEASLPNKHEHLGLIGAAIDGEGTHDIIARLGGDEFVVMSLIPPGENQRRGSEDEQVEALNKEKIRVQQSLSNIKVTYPVIRNEISDKKRDPKHKLNIITEPITGTHAEVEVTCTFALTRTGKFDSESIIDAISALGEVIEFRKEKRQSLETVGDSILIDN